MAIVRINAEPDEGSLVGRLGPQAHVQRIVLLGAGGSGQPPVRRAGLLPPRDFATQLGLDRTALTRALKTLAADLPIDYVPRSGATRSG